MKQKILAAMTDLTLSTCLSIGIALGIYFGIGMMKESLVGSLSSLAASFYWLMFNWDGQTVGYKLMNIRLVRMDGTQNYGWMRVSWRMSICYLSLFMVGFGSYVMMRGYWSFGATCAVLGSFNFLYPLSNKERYFFHDVASDTKVVTAVENKPLAFPEQQRTAYSDAA